MVSEKLYRNTLNLMLAGLSFTKLFVYVQFTVFVYRLIFPSTGIPKRQIRLIFVLRTTALGSKYFFFLAESDRQTLIILFVSSSENTQEGW